MKMDDSIIVFCRNCATHIKVDDLEQPELLPRDRDLILVAGKCPQVENCEHCINKLDSKQYNC